jgi:hypothetical protein
LATLLVTLKKVSFFQGIHCPYELLASIYHVALPFESNILDKTSHAESNPIATYIAAMALDTGEDSFDINTALHVLAGMVQNETQAAIMAYQLLNRLDLYLSGADSHQERGKRGTAIPSLPMDRYRNPNYYQPIKVCIAGEEASYTIVPRSKPLYSRWIEKPLPRDEAYFNQNTLAAGCLKYHRIFRGGQVGDHDVAFPVNGANGSRHLPFFQSFEPSGQAVKSLTIALAPYDAGFKAECLEYEKTERDTIPFRFVRTTDPPFSEVRDRLKAILTAAIDQGVDILIFPELVVDHDARTEIRRFLCHHNPAGQLKLVVAGSYHSERNEGGYVNQAPMFDWQGNIVWRHNKLSRYGQRDKKTGNLLEERIHTAHPLTFVDTPIGRIATLICLDYLQGSVMETIRKIGCDYLLVPLMTTSIDQFIIRARNEYGSQLHVLSACSASVSCCAMKKFSFLYAPSKSFTDLEKYSGRTEDENHSLIVYRLDKQHL